MLVVNSSPGEEWEDARGLAEKALELDPSLPPALAILGLAQSVLGEHEQGLESLRKAIEFDPSLGIAYQWITMPMRSLGRHDEAREMADRGLEIDPLNTVLLRNAARRASNDGDFERAEQLLQRLTGLPDPPAWTYLSLYNLYSEWGRYAEAIEAARDEVRRSVREEDTVNFELLVYAYASVGSVEDADYWFRQLRAQSPQEEPPIYLTNDLAELGAAGPWLSQDLEKVEALLSTAEDVHKPYLLTYGGLAQIQAGNFAKGFDWLERGIVLYEQDMADEPPEKIDYGLLSDAGRWWDEVIVMVARAIAFAGAETGQEDERRDAMRYLESIYAGLTEPANPVQLQGKAEIRVLSGDFEVALGHLQAALELGWANYYELVNRPVWAEATKRPGFQAVLREAKANVEEQREIVAAADAEYDFRAEVARLMSAKTETE
ncbi:MAG: tetratricopeptide repeat protein [Gammaproteobacteria bacterium]